MALFVKPRPVKLMLALEKVEGGQCLLLKGTHFFPSVFFITLVPNFILPHVFFKGHDGQDIFTALTAHFCLPGVDLFH